ncbi:MAG: peptide-methionine (S)-S-oxide reductase, partial [Terriglobales bacterium]
MRETYPKRIFVVFAAVVFAGGLALKYARAGSATTLPDPVVNSQLASSKGKETAVLAGGCFWGIQAVFQHVKGVKSATSGYSGGSASTAQYETVSTGETGHAESMKIVFDPSQITYGQLLKVFF